MFRCVYIFGHGLTFRIHLKLRRIGVCSETIFVLFGEKRFIVNFDRFLFRCVYIFGHGLPTSEASENRRLFRNSLDYTVLIGGSLPNPYAVDFNWFLFRCDYIFGHGLTNSVPHTSEASENRRLFNGSETVLITLSLCSGHLCSFQQQMGDSEEDCPDCSGTGVVEEEVEEDQEDNPNQDESQETEKEGEEDKEDEEDEEDDDKDALRIRFPGFPRPGPRFPHPPRPPPPPPPPRPPPPRPPCRPAPPRPPRPTKVCGGCGGIGRIKRGAQDILRALGEGAAFGIGEAAAQELVNRVRNGGEVYMDDHNYNNMCQGQDFEWASRI